MGKKRGQHKNNRLPMMRRIVAGIRHNKRLKTAPRRRKPQPRCSCCGSTRSLQSGWSCGKLIWLCPGAASEANNPRM